MKACCKVKGTYKTGWRKKLYMAEDKVNSSFCLYLVLLWNQCKYGGIELYFIGITLYVGSRFKKKLIWDLGTDTEWFTE